MRKAESSIMSLIMAFILVVAAGAVVFTFFYKTNRDVSRVTGRNIEALSADYDYDDIRDFYDKSPCVAGQEVITATNRKQYYYFADAITTNGEATCDVDAFKQAKINIDTEGSILELKYEAATGKGVCILPESACAKKLTAHYKSLREDDT